MNYKEDIIFVGNGSGFLSVECDTGLYKAFVDRDVVPGYAMASSGSALFSSLFYSKGIEWIENMVRTNSPFDFIEICPYQGMKTLYGKSNYIVDNSKIRELLEENMTGESTKRVEVSVTRMNDWSTHMKHATPAYTLAATSIPFVFKPVKMSNGIWSDGGIFNNIPCPSIEETKKWKHVFVFIAPKYVPFESENSIWGLLNLLNAVFDREFAQLKESGFFDLPNVHLIQPDDAFGGSLFAWSKNYKLMDHCYEKTMKILDEIGL